MSTPSAAAAASPTPTPPTTPTVPFRKRQKEQAKALKAAGSPNKKKNKADNQTVPGWELTVGIEIHAQLNTARKLLSPAAAPTTAAAPFNDAPNHHVALFDAAVPGSQPLFQPATLIPAVRAALSLGCTIQPVSRFDRKHYFHWDQPSGYQITQYYHPFARDGVVTLYPRDGIAPEDGDRIDVAIRQVQMEQDTAKTTAQPAHAHWIDFNRVGLPLVEIITHPTIHHPATAAAFVRKVQMLLASVDACVSGMEAGGLRADVNVSVRRDPTLFPSAAETPPLGTRTEIKNLSSFKAVEDAIIAERDRQIALLESGGVVEGETRGWSLGSTETRRLRAKEGEVDYRYMPDPDLGPVVIADDLVAHLASTMGLLPDAELDDLIERYGLSSKDALSLARLDDGARIMYFYRVLDSLEARLSSKAGKGGLDDVTNVSSPSSDYRHALLAANWCLHELGKLTELSSDLGMTPDGECNVPSSDLADILCHLHRREITARVAKDLLWGVFRGDIPPGRVTQTVDDGSLWFKELSAEEYAEVADAAVAGEDKVLAEFLRFKQGKAKVYPQGKLMFLVGKMMRAGNEQRMDPASAETLLRTRIERVYLPAFEAGN